MPSLLNLPLMASAIAAAIFLIGTLLAFAPQITLRKRRDDPHETSTTCKGSSKARDRPPIDRFDSQ
jgi:hypothetical protein